jgi:hypothetical protein
LRVRMRRPRQLHGSRGMTLRCKRQLCNLQMDGNNPVSDRRRGPGYPKGDPPRLRRLLSRARQFTARASPRPTPAALSPLPGTTPRCMCLSSTDACCAVSFNWHYSVHPTACASPRPTPSPPHCASPRPTPAAPSPLTGTTLHRLCLSSADACCAVSSPGTKPRQLCLSSTDACCAASSSKHVGEAQSASFASAPISVKQRAWSMGTTVWPHSPC